jgi:uncharacterized protein YjbK
MIKGAVIMAQNLEIEYKTMLDKSTYQRLVTHYQLKETDFHTQTNYYFDTKEGLLKKKNCGLRIRLLDNKAEYTLKTPEKDGRLETTDLFSYEEGKQITQTGALPKSGAVYKKLSEIGVSVDELSSIGYLTTKRAEFSIDEGLLALDESTSENLHDYELELEVSQAEKGEKDFHQLLNTLEIPFQPAKNKIQRMVDSKN